MSNQKIAYFLIHGGDSQRRSIMEEEFRRWNFPHVQWITGNNAGELSEELIDRIVMQSPSLTNGIPVNPSRMLLRKGLISCTYKHYLALQQISNDLTNDYGVIMEDNIVFTDHIAHLVPIYINQLNAVYGQGQWDIAFNFWTPHPWSQYREQPIQPHLLVYPKSNELNPLGPHGGTKSANFYMITRECAKQLVAHYIPFNNAPDWWMNDMFRKIGIRSFWVEPANVRFQDGHISTTIFG